MELCEEGFLDEMGVKLLGANPTTIAKAEDRQMFKDTMEKIGEPIIASKVVHTVEDAVAFTEEIGLAGHHPSGVHARRHRRRHCLHLGRAARNRGIRIMHSRVDEILGGKVHHRLEGNRIRSHARRQGQRHYHL